MKTIILAGGLGTRISEESSTKPKPMIEIGGHPILWHIMKMYSYHGIHDFIICCGYKGYVIKEYFANYTTHNSDITFDFRAGESVVHQNHAEPWRVTLIDTGEHSMTGGRLKRVQHLLEKDESFCFTYGDGVSDINITKEISFHQSHGRHVTLASVQPPGRYGALDTDGHHVKGFVEKPQGDGGRVNGGFFVLSPEVFSYIEGDETSWEREPLENLSKDGQVMAWEHNGFWQPMDTLRDKNHLESLWSSNRAPWRCW